jgi:hypothetical protein
LASTNKSGDAVRRQNNQQTDQQYWPIQESPKFLSQRLDKVTTKTSRLALLSASDF